MIGGDAFCANTVFYDGVEFRHLLLDCQDGPLPCAAGKTCDEVNNVCAANPCSTPVVSASGPRYLSVTPAPGNDAVAIRVTGDPADSDAFCDPSPKKHCRPRGDCADKKNVETIGARRV